MATKKKTVPPVLQTFLTALPAGLSPETTAPASDPGTWTVDIEVGDHAYQVQYRVGEDIGVSRESTDATHGLSLTFDTPEKAALYFQKLTS